MIVLQMTQKRDPVIDNVFYYQVASAVAAFYEMLV